MGYASFLEDKSPEYRELFLDLVGAHRQGDHQALTPGIEQLVQYHPAANDEPDTMRRLLRHLIEEAGAEQHTSEMAAESYASYGPGSTLHGS